MALLPHRKHAQLQRDQKTQRDRMEEIERDRERRNSPISKAMRLVMLVHWLHICDAYFMVRLPFQFKQCIHTLQSRKQ